MVIQVNHKRRERAMGLLGHKNRLKYKGKKTESVDNRTGGDKGVSGVTEEI